jgi:uncharacterized protein YxeA
MNKKTLFYIVIYGVAIYGGFYLYNNTKKAYARVILKNGFASGGEAPLLEFDKEYLKAWSKAIKSKLGSFTYNKVNYNTNGGKAIK